MRPLYSHDIIHIWEQGQFQHDIDRAITILDAVFSDKSRDKLATLTIGQRNAQLLMIREKTFGHRLHGYTQCPQCRERLQFTLAINDIRAKPAANGETEFEFSSRDIDLRIRLPDSHDLAAVSVCRDTDHAQRALLRRCVSQAVCGNQNVPVEDLPTPVIADIAQRLSEHDPQADIQLDLNCVVCTHRWATALDIVSFLWSEISISAKRLLSEVHALARAYGWHEADILALSSTRRQFYLNMVL
jgi:hypothetical protein